MADIWTELLSTGVLEYQPPDVPGEKVLSQFKSHVFWLKADRNITVHGIIDTFDHISAITLPAGKVVPWNGRHVIMAFGVMMKCMELEDNSPFQLGFSEGTPGIWLE